MRYNKALDAVMELAGGKLDAVIIDAPVAANLVASMNNENLVVLDNIEFGDEFYGIAVQKGNAESAGFHQTPPSSASTAMAPWMRCC